MKIFFIFVCPTHGERGEVKRYFLITHGVPSTALRQTLVPWFLVGYFNLVIILHVHRNWNAAIGEHCVSHIFKWSRASRRFCITKLLKACQQLTVCVEGKTYIFKICSTLIRLGNTVKAIRGK